MHNTTKLYTQQVPNLQGLQFHVCDALVQCICYNTSQYIILSHISTVCILLQYFTIRHSLTHIHCMYTVTILHNTSFSHTYPLYVYSFFMSVKIISMIFKVKFQL